MPGSFRAEPVKTHTADAEPVQSADLGIPGAVGQQHSVVGKVDGGVAIPAVGVAFEKFAVRLGPAAVGRNTGHERGAFALHHWELTGVIVPDSEQVG